ncbi:MAG: helix-turn-helix domain-containing protein [Micrococcales bacterium]|nr:helix-turn-helix domain-containing protein [Micrococcales bacterium]
MEQDGVELLLAQADRIGIRHMAGPQTGARITRIEIATVGELEDAPVGSLVIVGASEGRLPSAYQVDIAVRQAIARRFAGLVFAGAFPLAETARQLAARGAVPVLMADEATASELAVVIDRIVRGGAADALARAERAIELASAAATEGAGSEGVLAAASGALGTELSLVEDATVAWTDRDAVCIGELPVGRLVAATADAAVFVAVPVIAATLSRALQHELGERFAPTQSRADLLIELIYAESSRLDGFGAEAARLGFPLPLSHVVGWLRPTHRRDPELRAPRSVGPAVELFALQSLHEREEAWHVALIHDDVILVSSEQHGAGDHQRRLREAGERIRDYATATAGGDWVYTLGLGTPQVGASGLRQSAAEARIAVEAAIAGGRLGEARATDVTGLRRVLLEFYASPLSRRLLDDLLAPLDALGPEKSDIAVRTLAAYLGHRNSLVRAAAELNLHPNAVNYRVRRLETSLGLDLEDPDERFAVELACRMRLLAPTRGR